MREVHGRPGGAVHLLGRAAHHAAGLLRPRVPRALRARLAVLLPLHLADPALSGPGRPPPAQARCCAAGRRGVGADRASPSGCRRSPSTPARPSGGPSSRSATCCNGRRCASWPAAPARPSRGGSPGSSPSASSSSSTATTSTAWCRSARWRTTSTVYEPEAHRLVGEQQRPGLPAGRPVEVVLVGASPKARGLDFVLEDMPEAGSRPEASRRAQGKEDGRKPARGPKRETRERKKRS